MMQIEHLTKRGGPLAAVDNLRVTVEPGRVTGLLGPSVTALYPFGQES